MKAALQITLQDMMSFRPCFQKRAAIAQLEGIDFKGKEVIDIGCGTGIIAFLAMDSGAAKITCGDISRLYA